jgi:hypothetical protein
MTGQTHPSVNLDHALAGGALRDGRGALLLAEALNPLLGGHDGREDRIRRLRANAITRLGGLGGGWRCSSLISHVAEPLGFRRILRVVPCAGQPQGRQGGARRDRSRADIVLELAVVPGP